MHKITLKPPFPTGEGGRGDRGQKSKPKAGKAGGKEGKPPAGDMDGRNCKCRKRFNAGVPGAGAPGEIK